LLNFYFFQEWIFIQRVETDVQTPPTVIQLQLPNLPVSFPTPTHFFFWSVNPIS